MTLPLSNSDSERFIKKLREKLPQAILLEGATGVGLYTIAASIAGRDLAGVVRPTDVSGNLDTSDKGVIRIPQIRELIQQTRSKFTARQVIIIDDADKMNLHAQNAFLKLLEEPAPNVHFVLTSHHAQALLPTILSRVQQVHIQPISTENSKRLIAKLGIDNKRVTQQLLFLADGRPAELYRLANDKSFFAAQIALITDARTFIQGKIYERTMVVARYSSDRRQTLDLLTLALSILHYSIKNNPSHQLIATADRLADTYDRIRANGNTRLQLMNFVVQ